MPRRRPSADSLPFDTLRLEGSLFVPQLLERAAHGEAPHQQESDYDIPKGLKLHEEYGRAYRIALALWQDFAPAMLRKDLDATRATVAFTADFFRDALGYGDLTLSSGPVRTDAAVEREFPVTAFAAGGRVPLIIAPHTLDLDTPDTRFAILGSGARKKSAHQLAQEFLNASRDCLWAFVTNGRTLRLLRDADTLTRPNFLEFDLDTILRQGEDRYADFSALWRMLHASRAGAGAAPTECVWEQWKSAGHAEGTRIRKGLSDGVTQTLLKLGNGFLAHPDNAALRQRLHDGELSREDYFQQLLRLVYRWLFLFCAEERDLLHPPMPEDPGMVDAARLARHAYGEGYSMRRLRSRCLRQFAHDSHGDVWVANRIVFRSLGRGEPRLDLPALGGLFSADQCPDLDGSALGNRDLLAAMRELRWFFDRKSGQRSAVDYRNMGTEELGSVYESLLELVPQLDLPARQFGFAGITDDSSTSGNARKTSGSYYTPDSLVQELIKSALDPVIQQRLAEARSLAPSPWAEVSSGLETDPAKLGYVRAFLERHAGLAASASLDALGRAWDAMPAHERENPLCAEALLALAVCDPSCGSGHFLLAAARRLAERLAELRASEGAVRPDDYRHALREVASRCLYGVDLNPMAVELCRVALWLETVDPGKPLGFLDHHIRCGNSLLGTTPELIAAGIPDGAFNAIEGDDKAACAELKKRNKKEREGFGPLFEKEEQSIRDSLRQAASRIEFMDDENPEALHRKEEAFERNEMSSESRHAKLLADLWCAAFVIKKHYPVTDGRADPDASSATTLPALVGEEIHHTQEDLFDQHETTPPSKPASKRQASRKTQDQGTPLGITTSQLRDFVQGKPLPTDVRTEVEALACQYRFFHWHIAFPQVFDQGGFACILGNPPWERVQTEEKQFFSLSRPDIAAARSKDRQQLIDGLESEDHSLWISWHAANRMGHGQSNLVKSSGKFPHSGKGNVNTFALFAELASDGVNPRGRVGFILPSGVITEASNEDLFRSWLENHQIVSGIDFENSLGLFPDVHRSFRFCILTLCGHGAGPERPAFRFFLSKTNEASDLDELLLLGRVELELLNPSSLTCPPLRSKRDAELLLMAHRKFGIFVAEKGANSNPWQADSRQMLNSSHDSGSFVEITDENLKEMNQSGFLPAKSGLLQRLYDGKMVDQFDHRLASTGHNSLTQFRTTSSERTQIAEYARPDYLVTPQYWVPASKVLPLVPEYCAKRGWWISFRAVTASTNWRTLIAAVLPMCGQVHSLPALYSPALPQLNASLTACLNSFILDFYTRLKLSGTHLSHFVFKQLPVPSPLVFKGSCQWDNAGRLCDWLLPRVLELTYTAWDLEAFAVDCGWPGPPFRWDENRRFLLRCELDAAFFHLYLGTEEEWCQQPEALTDAFPTPRDAASYIMDTFPIVKRKDEAKHGTYRTKDTILEIYDSLAEAIATGSPYKTLLDPPPASFRVAHPPRLPAVERSAERVPEDVFLMFVIQFVRQSGSEATLPLLSQAWHRFADLTRYRTELSGILSESQFTAWQESQPVTRIRQGFHEFVSNFVGSHQLAFDESSLVISFTDDSFNDIEGDSWISTDVFLSLLLLTHDPEIEQWLPGKFEESDAVRLASLHEFHLIA